LNKKGIFLFTLIILVCLAYFSDAKISQVTLKEPVNMTWSTNGSLMFKCNATANESNYITNVTLYVWTNDSTATYNTSFDNTNGSVNGTVDNVTFTLTSIPERQGYNYTWNCMWMDNASNKGWSTANKSFGVDTNVPAVALVSPSNGGQDLDRNIDFTYNVTDNNTIQNCSVYINNVLNSSDTSVSKGVNEIITVLNVNQTDSLTWYVRCYDGANRSTNSSTYTVDTYDNSPSTSGGGGSGGSNRDDMGNIEELQTMTKTLEENSYLYVTASGTKHKLKVGKIGNGSVNVTLYSTVISNIIKLGETKVFDLEGDYDLSVKLNSIAEDSVSLTLKNVKTTLPNIQQSPQTETTGTIETPQESPSTPVSESEGVVKEQNYTFLWIIIGLVVIIGTYFVVVKKKK